MGLRLSNNAVARLARKGDATPDELAFVASVDAVVESAVAEGRQARLDNAMLVDVIKLEAANSRLSLPIVEPEVDEEGNIVNQEAVNNDTTERDQAQAVVDSASEEAKELYLKRNPVFDEHDDILNNQESM